MKKINLQKWLPVVCMNIFWIPGVQAQNPCEQALNLARQKYYDGAFHEALALIENCLEKTALAPAEKAAAHALITQVHLANDDTVQARIAANKLLENSPDFQPTLEERLDFSKLISTLKKQRGALLAPPVETANPPQKDSKKTGSKKWWWIGGAATTTAGTVALILSRQKPKVVEKKEEGGFTGPPERP